MERQLMTSVWPASVIIMLTILFCTRSAGPAAENASAPAEVDGYQTSRHAGWTVHINDRLLFTQQEAMAAALVLMDAHLADIIRVVPPAAVVALQDIPLWFNPEYPGIQPRAEYHPEADWLRENHRNPRMAKGVEFTCVRTFLPETKRMPAFVLHELAHGFHDRVLGFEQSEIIAAYEHASASGVYDQVERSFGDGRPNTRERAYAMTNHKEYFAESTESFFIRNDFFPWVRADLHEVDPLMEQVLERVWSGVK